MDNIRTSVAIIIPVPASVMGEKFNIALGENEAIELRALTYNFDAPETGPQVMESGLYRKSDKNPSSIWDSKDSDIIWATRDANHFVTESIIRSVSKMIHFPKSIILVRPPRLITKLPNILPGNPKGYVMRLYYRIIKVSKHELTKLLIKDHD
jgi:hypothetical protein